VTIAHTGGNLPVTWDLAGAELAFSAAAAHALLTHHGDVRSALHAVATNTASLPAAEQRAVARRIFARNPFMATLREEIDRERKLLLSRQVSIALDRTNRDAALRAIDSLAPIAGWYASTKRDTAPPFVRSIGRSDADELALMQHEPGAAVASPSDARDDFTFSTLDE
jgi:hypothetical protein